MPPRRLGRARVLISTRADGDFHLERVPPAELEQRRRALVDLPWTMPLEVHGTEVLVVEHPGALDGERADAAATAVPGAVLGIWVGDCAPVALVGDGGVIGAVHAGWRGLEAGVVGRALDAMAALGAGRVTALLGPCIRPCCYEFDPADLRRMVERFGPAVVGRTAWGAPALDVPAAVRAELAALDVDLLDDDECTGCRADRYWSHRRRREPQRQLLAIWQVSA